jgi:FtsH-binding integral membrane protein
MKKYVKEFLHRGLLCMGFGPLVLAIVFAILSLCGVVQTLAVSEIVLGIFTITIMAFVAAGVSIVYKIEELPLLYAILIHGVTLHVDYLAIYLVNGWLKDGVTPLIVFTVVFVLGFLLTWSIVYLFIRKDIKKINRKIIKG